jgi:hypothetical protein
LSERRDWSASDDRRCTPRSSTAYIPSTRINGRIVVLTVPLQERIGVDVEQR